MYKAAVVKEPNKPIVIEERPIPKATKNHVVIKVEACGICHGDTAVLSGHWPGMKYPRVPGHEVVGLVHEVGAEVIGFQIGDKVGVGWHGSHCFNCDACRRGNFGACGSASICAISYDGGYGEYMMAPTEALVHVPKEMDSAEAAPLLCAGLTVYNSLRHHGGQSGMVCAVLGLGGLGHLGIQYARKLGYVTVAISTGSEKQALAMELGAHHYINSSTQKVGEELLKLGGAKLILATAPSSKAIDNAIAGIARGGKIIIVAADPTPLSISPITLLSKQITIVGWASGLPTDSEDTLRFSQNFGVKAMIEKFKLEDVQKGIDAMLSSKVKFRSVIVYK